MAQTIKYIGTANRWPELAITGNQSVWSSGQQEQRGDLEATLLLGTGLFVTVQDPWVNPKSAAAPALRNIARMRAYGKADNASGTYTMFLTDRTPMHYDAVRAVVYNASTGVTAALKLSIAPTAKYNDGYHPVDASNAAVAFVPFTWGSTNPEDFRNPGGGATTIAVPAATGTNAAQSLVEGRAVSDWINVSSLDRADTVGLPPLFMLRLYGLNPPAVSVLESASGYANPFTSARPDFFSGYWTTTDYTAGGTPPAPNQNFIPCVELQFLSRGRLVQSIAFADDSLGQGWVAGTAVPQFGGLINGWGQRLVAKINAAGGCASFDSLCQTGNKSIMFHERLYNALQDGGISHAIFKPWSVNEILDGFASVQPALARTSKLIELSRSKGVKPILTRPWAGQGGDVSIYNAIQVYCDNAAASGVAVFDARDVVSADITSNVIRPEYLTRTAGLAVVDTVHLNEAGQEAVAQRAFDTRSRLGL